MGGMLSLSMKRNKGLMSVVVASFLHFHDVKICHIYVVGVFLDGGVN